MEILGIVTILLTIFTLIFYAYLDRHSERDVSFFMSVCFISIVMNLFTNASGIFGLCYLYLAIAVVFLALGFAVSVQDTIGFYTSIGPWCKKTFTNKDMIGWQVLSAICFPAGIALYFTWYKSKNVLAKECGKCGIWGLLCWAIILWAILGLIL